MRLCISVKYFRDSEQGTLASWDFFLFGAYLCHIQILYDVAYDRTRGVEFNLI